MAHEDVLIPGAGDEDSEEGHERRPRTDRVWSATAGWIEVDAEHRTHWDDAHLWHDRPPR